jgi:hypothetical protein
MSNLDIRQFIAEMGQYFEVRGKYHVSPYVPRKSKQADGTMQDSVYILQGEATPLRHGKPLVLMHRDLEETFLGMMGEIGQKWEKIDWKTEPLRHDWANSFLDPNPPYIPDEEPPHLRFTWGGTWGYR